MCIRDRYTFLAVGVDDRSGSVYQFPDAIKVGTKLADCQAKLDEAQRTFMPNADLYVGVTTTQIQAANYNRVEVELKRKVAGVIVYLQNIPCQPEGVFVKRLEVNLHTNQHTALPLIRNEANPYGCLLYTSVSGRNKESSITGMCQSMNKQL